MAGLDGYGGNMQSAAGADGRDAGAPGVRVWGVAALIQAVGDTLAARYGTVAVRGEISGLTRAASGHGYFTLKDESGQVSLRCAMFRRALSLVDFPLSEGMVVQARGQLSVYGARGELQLVVEALSQGGAGALYEQFLRLKARLEAMGLFDPARRRPIEPFPRRVAIVTSLAGAALHDVLTALQRRAPHVAVMLLPCLVQGAQAPAQIVDALARVGWWQRQHEGSAQAIDTVIVCRGGGSMEDLWCFNDESVVRAMAACPVPVIAGIGHETDVTLADLAADLRAPTPTAAAELAAQARSEALDELDATAQALNRRLRQRLDDAAQRLDRAALRMARPAQALLRHRQGLATQSARLSAVLPQRLALARQDLAARQGRLARAASQQQQAQCQKLTHLGQRLGGLDPRQVLERGYAWVSAPDGQALTRAAQLRPGQAMVVEMRDGRVAATVDAIEGVDVAAGALPPLGNAIP